MEASDGGVGERMDETDNSRGQSRRLTLKTALLCMATLRPIISHVVGRQAPSPGASCFKSHGLIINMRQTSGDQDRQILSPRKGQRKTRDSAECSTASRGWRGTGA